MNVNSVASVLIKKEILGNMKNSTLKQSLIIVTVRTVPPNVFVVSVSEKEVKDLIITQDLQTPH